jgi:hypothetical protein
VPGTIWLLWIAAALPWSVAALVSVARGAASRSGWRDFACDPRRVYLALWAMTPMAFFTPAGNILITYVLPGLPAFALLVGESWRPDRGDPGRLPEPAALRRPVIQTVVVGALFPAIFTVGVALLHGTLEAERSQKALVQHYESLRPRVDSKLVYYLERPDSAQFYSRGRTLKVLDWNAFHARLDEAPDDMFAIRQREMSGMVPADRARLEALGTYGDYLLLREVRH